MDRFRSQIRAMPPAQRNTLLTMTGLVVVIAVAVVIAAAGGSSGTSTSTTPTVAPATTPPPVTNTTPASTTSQAPTTTIPATTTTTEPEVLELRPDGLGDLTFGHEVEGAIAYVSALLGSPDDDTGWVDKNEGYGTCVGTEVRFVRWGSLELFFTDGPSDWAAGIRHLAFYTDTTLLGDPRITATTAEGIGVGSTVDDIIGAYGTDARIEDDPLLGPTFFLDTPGAGQLSGYLTGLGSTDTLQSLSAGFACAE